MSADSVIPPRPAIASLESRGVFRVAQKAAEVTRAYQQLLGRAPTSRELEYWVSMTAAHPHEVERRNDLYNPVVLRTLCSQG